MSAFINIIVYDEIISFIIKRRTRGPQEPRS